AAQGMTAEDSIRTEHQSQAAGQVSVANAITSLRLCSTLDWTQHFENVSLIEQVLQRDPAGVYGRMDFLSRDRYRQAVEELAEATGHAAAPLGPARVGEGRQGAGAKAARGRGAHGGYHLVGEGRRRLQTGVAYRPPLTGRARPFNLAHPNSFYLGSIGLGV